MNKIVVGNMKMNLTAKEINDYLNEANSIDSDRVIICPTSIYIPYFLKHKYNVGIQNVFFNEEGAFTGEVSCKQAKSLGVKFAIIGHSERRIIFDESDDDINKKLKEALNQGLKVILCVGETKEEKDLLKTEKVLKKQLTSAFRNLPIDKVKNICIAYEPIWAIGSGEIPTNEEIEKIVYFIKSTVLPLYELNDISVLYGGSINDKNIKTLNKIKNINGFLVGGASLDAKKFKKIIKEVIN